ncbi:MAG TPA: multiheme c-type cytochrome, partial [Candidatus Baltobacteraceae bacterium]|nr:multiheme c-type cytochrome [Candidatus Baltobacteraceae bacterium]
MLGAGICALLSVGISHAQQISTNLIASKFLGANSCASSSCHGGGGQNQNQFLVWSLRDFHSQRPFATLTMARAKQIADILQIKDAATDARCTICHAPLHEVPESLRGKDFKVSEGVSC